MREQTLSICMIVKNESANLDRCLNSVKNVADQIVVVDTGSTDNTKDIAKKYGALVLDYEWDHDFSGARNKSLEHATGDWVLVLDADEELEPEEAVKIKQVINQDLPYKAFYLRLVNMINGVDIGNAIVLRLFINGEDHRFKGKLHEQIINKLQDKYGNDCVGQTAIRILHYGYDPVVSDAKKKSKRNLDILLTYDEKDKDGYYYYVLGNEYARIDDFEEALRIYNKALSVTDYKRFTYIYYPYLVMNIAKVLSNARRFQEEVIRLREFEKVTPYFKDLYFMEALALIECSKMTEAKEALAKYMNCPQGSYEYPCSNFESTYNIPDLMDQLIKGAIRKENKLLNAYIFMNEDVESVVEAVKSVNEIAYEVVVIKPKASTVDTKPIENVGGRIETSDRGMKDYPLKLTKARYTLFMRENEICSFVSQQQINEELIGNDTIQAMTVDLVDMGTQIEVPELRIVHNNKRYVTLGAYEKAVEKEEVELEESCIMIHKKVLL